MTWAERLQCCQLHGHYGHLSGHDVVTPKSALPVKADVQTRCAGTVDICAHADVRALDAFRFYCGSDYEAAPFTGVYECSEECMAYFEATNEVLRCRAYASTPRSAQLREGRSDSAPGPLPDSAARRFCSQTDRVTYPLLS